MVSCRNSLRLSVLTKHVSTPIAHVNVFMREIFFSIREQIIAKQRQRVGMFAAILFTLLSLFFFYKLLISTNPKQKKTPTIQQNTTAQTQNVSI